MKLQTIKRGIDYSRESNCEIYKTQRSLDSTIHGFERQREYIRGLNSVKLEKLFSKPFINDLKGHVDGVYVLAKPVSSLTNSGGSLTTSSLTTTSSQSKTITTPLTSILSGDGSGEIRLWNLSTQKTVWSAKPFSSFVRGLCFVPFDLARLVCVGEKSIHIYNTTTTGSTSSPVVSFLSNNVFNGLAHHRFDRVFATCSSVIQLWDHSRYIITTTSIHHHISTLTPTPTHPSTRSEPTTTMEWGSETINTVKFNQTETSVLASCGSDRSIILYDIRTNKPVSKVFMKVTRTSTITLDTTN